MKILIFNSLYYPYKVGGAEKSVQLLAESLQNKGHQVCIATLHELNYISEEVFNGVKIVRFPLKNIYWNDNHSVTGLKKIVWHLKDIYNKKMYLQVESFFSNELFDVVHTNNISGFSVSVWSWAKKRGFPLVHTSRDYYLLHPNTTLFRNGENVSPNEVGAKIFSVIKRLKSKNVDCFISISNFVNDIHVKNKYFTKSLRNVIYNSVVTNYSQSYDEFEVNYGNCDGNLVLGYLGRIEQSKGIEHLISVLNKLNKSEIEIKIAGKGNEEFITYLQGKYKDIRMYFLGQVEIDSFLPKIDYLIVPSLWNEPMGRVVIEAYSYGVPVIGSKRGGIREIIDDGLTGYLYEPGDSESMTNIIENLPNRYEQAYQALVAEAKSKVKYFESDRMVSSYLTSYSDVIVSVGCRTK